MESRCAFIPGRLYSYVKEQGQPPIGPIGPIGPIAPVPPAPLLKCPGNPSPFIQRQCFCAPLQINFSLAKHDACASMTLDDLLERRGRVSQVIENRLASL